MGLRELLRQNPRSCDFSAARPLTLRRNGGPRLGHLGDDHHDRHPDNRHDLLLHGAGVQGSGEKMEPLG